MLGVQSVLPLISETGTANLSVNKWGVYDFMLLSTGIGLQEHIDIIDNTLIYRKQNGKNVLFN